MTLTPQDLVAREVHYCVSSLVSILTAGYDDCANKDLNTLCEQAVELASPIDDWEEAAIDSGWYIHPEFGTWVQNREDSFGREDREEYSSAQDAMDGNEPYQREVFEHWIVSDWMADQLEAEGEKIDRDFTGLTVWARTTTGQAIYADSVIERICATLNN